MAQLELLRELGYSEVQGNYVSKPLAADEIHALVRAASLQLFGGELFGARSQ